VRARSVKTLIAALVCCQSALAQVTLTEGTDISVDVAPDGRIVMDLVGGIWVVPLNGGAAEPLDAGVLPAERPRWSPDGSAIVFEARSEQRSGLYLYDLTASELRALGAGRYSDRQPDWHPDGERVVFASQRHDTGLDLWELDVPTGLSWRITSVPGDESEPAWSADGRNLVYIRHHDDRWSLVLRRFGEPDRALVVAEERLSAPSWRPDGSLVTFARESAGDVTMNMVILSDPLLERVLISDQDLFVAPVAWYDRQQMLYAANGQIRKRDFNSWVSRKVPFRATVGRPVAHAPATLPVRELAVSTNRRAAWSSAPPGCSTAPAAATVRGSTWWSTADASAPSSRNGSAAAACS
jgi:dipeptidyl aminopeptidase/acylaminoacyl peptidase